MGSDGWSSGHLNINREDLGGKSSAENMKNRLVFEQKQRAKKGVGWSEIYILPNFDGK